MPKTITSARRPGGRAAGAVTAIAFPKFDLMFFAWISLIPLFFLLAKARPRHGLLPRLDSAGAVFYAILLYWIPAVPAHYGRLPIVLSLLIDGLLVLTPGLNLGRCSAGCSPSCARAWATRLLRRARSFGSPLSTPSPMS